MKLKPVKVLGGVIVGTNPAYHLMKAYGRSVFRLCHVSPDKRRNSTCLYLRDLPLSLADLKHGGWWVPYFAYQMECIQHGVLMDERVC